MGLLPLEKCGTLTYMKVVGIVAIISSIIIILLNASRGAFVSIIIMSVIFFFISVKVDSVSYYFGVVKAMFVPNTSATVSLMQIFDTKSFIVFAAGFIFGFPVYKVITSRFGKSNVFKWLEAGFLLVLFGAALSSSTMVFSDPFFYFRF